MREVTRMRADHELSSEICGFLQLVMLAQYLIRLPDKDLLNLRMEMCLWLLDENQVKRRDERALGCR